MNSWRQYQVSRGLRDFMRLLGIMVLCLITMAGFSGATLKAQGVAGAIQGTVQDSSGAVIPGATVTASNAETGLKRSVASSSVGFFAISNLPPGGYLVEVSAPGFQRSVYQNIVLSVGQQLVLNTTLQLGEIQQQVTVTGEASDAVQTRSSEVSGVVSPTRVQELPLLGRDFRDLTSLIPGVVPMPAAYTSGAVVGTTSKSFRTSVAGGRLSATAYYLDGLYLNQRDGFSPQGVTGGQLGVDTVREFRVLVNSYSAEFPRAGSGVINMVSRSGTNSFHGSVFEFLRNDKVNARNFFDIPDKAPLRRNQFGFSLGGPIQKDKTFFFGTWEGLREREGLSVVSRVPDLNARKGLAPDGQGGLRQIPIQIPQAFVDGVMALYPLPNGRSFGDGSAENITLFSAKTRDDLMNFRVDRSLSSNHNLFFRYTFNDGTKVLPRATPNFLSLPKIRQQWASLQEDWVASPTAVNTFRVGVTRLAEYVNEQPAEGTQLGPGTILPGRVDPSEFTFANFSTAGARTQSEGGGEFNTLFQISDDFTVTTSKHTVKLGANLHQFQADLRGDRTTTDGRANYNQQGIWRFQTLDQFFSGRSFEFRDSVMGPGVTTNGYRNRNTFLGAYIQNEFRATHNLTLNMGLRLEHQTPVSRSPQLFAMQNVFADTSTVPLDHLYRTPPVLAPRVGIAWTPFGGAQDFVIRGGAGVFYDMLGDGLYSNGMGLNLPYRSQTVLRGAPFPDPYINGLPSAGLANTYNYDPVQNMPTVYQFNLSLAKRLGPIQVTTGYVGSQSRHLTVSKYVNTYPRFIVNGREFNDKTGPTRNPNYAADIILNTTEGNAYYNSLQFNAKSQFGAGSSMEGSYTYSKCLDTRSIENTSDIGGLREKYVYDAANLRNEKGRCGMDITQRVAMSFIQELPFQNLTGFAKAILAGWSLSGIIQVSNGAPFTPKVTFPRANLQVTTGGNARQERPDLTPGLVPSENVFPGNSDQYYNPALFTLQPEGFIGTAGRNILVGPGLATVDVSVSRTIPLPREGVHLQFRAEFFNLFNRVNFGLPEWQIFTNTTGRPNAAAGRISNTSTGPRNMQFALKLVF